jgi:hypothetical protein
LLGQRLRRKLLRDAQTCIDLSSPVPNMRKPCRRSSRTWKCSTIGSGVTHPWLHFG